MGTDKGLLSSAVVPGDDIGSSHTWAQDAFFKLQSLSIPVKISVNTNQLAKYSKIFAPGDLIADNESLKIKGPLCGVLSAHLQYPSDDLIILACDMPLMETDILRELIDCYQQSSATEAFVFKNKGEPEPLCGIYSAKGLARIYNLYTTGQLTKHSMKFMLELLSICSLPLPDHKNKYFMNFNTHAELNRS